MKILEIGDLHFGERGNSRKYNEQLLEALEWVSRQAQEHKVDAIVQLGDYFHHRSKIQVETLQYGIRGARILKESGVPVYVLSGNHDLFYLDRLDVKSIEAISPYVTVIDSLTRLDETVVLSPWIATGEQWDELINEGDSKTFCLGHFELNGFMVNERYTMEHGYSPVALRVFQRVHSGHYHSPQEQGNVRYIGTLLPVTMNEANEEHGALLVDTETGEETWLPYDRVKVLSVPYSDLEALLEGDLDPENTTIRVEFPDDLEDETVIKATSDHLKEMGFEDVKTKYKGKKASELMSREVENLSTVEDIDARVVSFIKESEDVSGVDKNRLERIYHLAIEKSKENSGE